MKMNKEDESYKPDFLKSKICTSGMNCMNCRLNDTLRKQWAKQYEMPPDIDKKCGKGKSMEQIKEEYKIVKEMMKNNKNLPNLASQAKNYANHLSRKYMSKMLGEEVTVPQEIFEERLEICQSNKCGFLHVSEKDNGEGEKYEVYKCSHKKCGCNLYKKLWESTERCPIGKWKKCVW
jgi:hypothetical protein